jgi:hypothetical protein
MIPIETFSFLLLSSAFLDILERQKTFFSSSFVPVLSTSATISAMGWTLGLLSLVLSPDPIGAASLVFHVAAAATVNQWMSRLRRCNNIESLALGALVAWTVAWTCQVVVGHWMWEGNQPNVVADFDHVSLLAMTQSVMIAWQS